MKTLQRRRKQARTDYGKRLKLLKGEKPRMVIRKTNKYIIAQYVTSKQAQDKIEFGITSKKLLEHGWPKEAQGSLKSLAAAYFTGMLAGKKIKKEELETPIIDFGMHRSRHKTRIYAFIKGLKDSGVEIKCDEKTFPEEDRLKGKHMKHKIAFEKISKEIEHA